MPNKIHQSQSMAGLRRCDIDVIKIGQLPQVIEEEEELSKIDSRYYCDDSDNEDDEYDNTRYREYEDVKWRHSNSSKPTDVIRNCLLSIQTPNLFSCGGSIYDPPSPGLYIDEIGVIEFPLGEEQAKHIINKSEMAPFGMREKTIFDKNIRHSWQMNPSRFTIKNSEWDSAIKCLVHHVCNKLGHGYENVKYSLYKLLIYEPGSFFKPHCDTEKEKGMFGTLIVVLPSTYSGGQLVVRHSGREYEYDFGNTEGLKTSFAGFYADCEHEIKPVTAGYRMCLVYNLVDKGDKTPLSIKFHAAVLKQMLEAFEKWIIDIHECPPFLLYGLDHQYTSQGLSFNHLKGKDIIIAQVLKEISRSVPLDISMVNMKRSLLERNFVGESITRERTTIIEIASETGDTQTQLKNVLIYHDNMIQADFWANKIPEWEGSIPTGNNGAVPTQFYYDTGIIFSPVRIRHHKYLRRDFAISVEYLNTLKERCDVQEALPILSQTIKNTNFYSLQFRTTDIFYFFQIIFQYGEDQGMDIFKAILERDCRTTDDYIKIAWKLYKKFPTISTNTLFRELVIYIIDRIFEDIKKYGIDSSRHGNITRFRKLLDIDFARD